MAELHIKPAIVPGNAEELSRGLWAWRVPGAQVVLPFLSSDPLKDSEEWLEDQAAGLPRQDFDREYLCDFSVFTGKPVYPEYRDHLHLSKKPLPYVPNRVIVRGWDIPGPLACVWCQLVPMDARKIHPGMTGSPLRLHVLAELYADIGIEEFARQVQAQSRTLFPDARSYVDWADPQAWAAYSNDKRSANDIIRAATGMILSPGPVDNTSRQHAVRSWLTRMAPTEGPNEPAGAMVLDPSCVMIRDGFKSGYHFKEIEKSGRFKEIPEKNEYSHPMNALEYAFARLGESVDMQGGRRAPKIRVPQEAVLGTL